MAKKNTGTTQLTSTPTHDLKNGICYFKLPEEYFIHEGDETKSCGLLGTDMDSNFHFLESYDISAVTFDALTKELTLIRYNGDEVSAVVDITLGDPTLEYDAENGVLYVYYPNGTSAFTSGFPTCEIYTNETLRGDGSQNNPLRLSELERTGMFAPVNEYLDLYDGGELPKGAEKGYRIISKEKVSDFGELYDYRAVDILRNELSGSPWHVPTEEEWVELIDAIDEDEEWIGHESDLLKSVDYWVSGSTQGYDSFGFRALPTGYDNNPDADYVERYGAATAFWSEDSASTVDAYVHYILGDGTITGNTENKFYSHFAIRLVKDYVPNSVDEYETILGTTLPTKVINICDRYSKVWTTANFYFSDGRIRGIVAPEVSGAVSTAYFINEWDGEKWERKKLFDGESVVIINKEGSKPYREWRLVNGEIEDVFEMEVASAATRIAALEEKVSILSATSMTREDVIDIIKNFIIGTEREIKITTTDEHLQIGFADDSIFGETDGLINQ